MSALGGFPFALKSHIENDLESMQLAGFKPLFVFSGLDVGKRDHSGRKEAAATAANLRGWELYDQHQPVKAVETFGDSGGTAMRIDIAARTDYDHRFDQARMSLSICTKDPARK